MTKSTYTSPLAEIQNLLKTWAEATRLDQKDLILANHAVDVTIFDVLPPLQYKDAESYRKSWDEWQPETVGSSTFEIHDLKITAGEEVAFAHGLIRCGGTRPDGSGFEDWVRATFCLCYSNGQWLIAHQHISMPAQ